MKAAVAGLCALILGAGAPFFSTSFASGQAVESKQSATQEQLAARWESNYGRYIPASDEARRQKACLDILTHAAVRETNKERAKRVNSYKARTGFFDADTYEYAQVAIRMSDVSLAESWAAYKKYGGRAASRAEIEYWKSPESCREKYRKGCIGAEFCQALK